MEEHFIKPSSKGFTIYSKTACKFCIKLKEYFNENKIKYKEIMCDEYTQQFFSFINKCANREYKTFPMVFYDAIFIGGYKESLDYSEKLKIFEENAEF